MPEKKTLYSTDTCLRDIRDSAQAIEDYTQGITEDQFRHDRMRQDAVIRRIEIMGEASNRIMKIDADYATNFSEVPLTKIYAIRNKVAHGYDGINLDVVWDTATRSIPPLRHVLDTVILRREHSQALPEPTTQLDRTRQAIREIAEFSGLPYKREALQKNLIKLVQDLSQTDRAQLTPQENQVIDNAVKRGKGVGR